MRFFAATFVGFAVATTCCIGGCSGYPDEHRSTFDEQQSGVGRAAPLTPFPQNDERQAYVGTDYKPFQNKRRCPLCDSSIYPYCGEKMLHDACCCTDPLNQQLPYQCKLADCRFLHANSCREHRLIANCCCSDDYRTFLKATVQA